MVPGWAARMVNASFCAFGFGAGALVYQALQAEPNWTVGIDRGFAAWSAILCYQALVELHIVVWDEPKRSLPDRQEPRP